MLIQGRSRGCPGASAAQLDGRPGAGFSSAWAHRAAPGNWPEITSDNDCYVAFVLPCDSMTEHAPAPDDPWRDLAGNRTTHAACQGAGASASVEGLCRRLPVEGAPPEEPKLPAEVVPAAAEIVPAAPVASDEARLRERVTQAHLALDGAHAGALQVLADVAAGKATDHRVTRDGEVVEVPVAAATRVSAARALLDHAVSVTKAAPITVETANILSVGELITRIDPDRLRAAVERLQRKTP